jgi:uncharacterized protein YqjF (DUF2071 family)
MPRRLFLTAQWRYLSILNFRIDPEVLRSYVPAGTELDTWRGDALASVVGFRFVDTRVLGWPIPFHRNFDEVNLRFYVRRLVDGEVRRAVTFIREVVPRRAIALVARLAYNEPYVTCRMRSQAPDIPAVPDPGCVEYAWRYRARWNAIRVRAAGPPRVLEAGSQAEFITEHYWGYTPQPDGRTVEYEVRHPSWRVWSVADAELDCDIATMYGAPFVEALSAAPYSAFLAEGSAVEVCRPVPLNPSR